MIDDMPYFNPEIVEEECFPIEHDIEYVGGVRVERVTVFLEGRTRVLWSCGHGQTGVTPEEVAANCVTYCGETI